MARLSEEQWAQVSLLLVGSYGARVSEVGVQALYALLVSDFPDVSVGEAMDAVVGHVRESVHPPTYAELRARLVASRRARAQAEAYDRRLRSEPEFAESEAKRAALSRGDVDAYLAIGPGGVPALGRSLVEERAEVVRRIAEMEARGAEEIIAAGDGMQDARGGFSGALLAALRARLAAIDAGVSVEDERRLLISSSEGSRVLVEDAEFVEGEVVDGGGA